MKNKKIIIVCILLIAVCQFVLGDKTVRAQDKSAKPNGIIETTGSQKLKVEKEVASTTGQKGALNPTSHQAFRKTSLTVPVASYGQMGETSPAYKGIYYHDDIALGWDADEQ